MILVAKRARGAIRYSDAFFPLILLNWGQAANFLWGWQVQFIASTVLAYIVLLNIVLGGARRSLGTAATAGICLLLLPLCGANGLALVPTLALWLGYSAIVYRRSGEPHANWGGLLILGFALSALLLVAFYFHGYESVPYHPTTTGVLQTLSTSAKFITLGFGPAMRDVWPFSGLVIFCLLLLSAAVLLWGWRNEPQERLRVLGFLSFLGAMASLALGLGLGRDGFETRYVTLAAPAWCCVYYLFTMYSPAKISFSVRTLLFLFTSLTLWPNAHFGVTYAMDLRNHLGSFERDMAAGVPAYQLIHRYGPYLHPHQDILTDYMPMLRRAGVGQFRFLQENPGFHEISVPLDPIALNQVTWKQDTAYATGYYPYVMFALQEERYVSGIRLKYNHRNENGTLPYVSVYWKGGDQDSFSEDQFWKYTPTGDRANWKRGTWTRLRDPETASTIWICDYIKELRIHPDFTPGVFTISELVVLLPAEEHQRKH
jgi:hypothetical protein